MAAAAASLLVRTVPPDAASMAVLRTPSRYDGSCATIISRTRDHKHHSHEEDAARGSGSVRGLKCVMLVTGSAPVPRAQGTARLDRQRPADAACAQHFRSSRDVLRSNLCHTALPRYSGLMSIHTEECDPVRDGAAAVRSVPLPQCQGGHLPLSAAGSKHVQMRYVGLHNCWQGTAAHHALAVYGRRRLPCWLDRVQEQLKGGDAAVSNRGTQFALW